MKKQTFYFAITLLSSASIFVSGCKTSQKSQASSWGIPKFIQNIPIEKGTLFSQYQPCEPSIAINPLQTKELAAGAILNRFYYSHDGGITWQSNKLRSTMGVYGDPVLLADWKGNFYYAHLSDPEGTGWSSEKMLDRIVIQKSSDKGKNYNDGSHTGVRSPKKQDKQWLAVDPKTNALYCTWTEFDKYNSKAAEDKSRILFSKSTDEGKTWSEGIAINQYDGDCLDDDNTTEGAVPAAGPNGEIYVSWGYNNKIYFDKSTDGGATWLKEDKVVADQPGGWSIDIPGIGRCNGMPVLASDLSNSTRRGDLYINWADQRNGSNDTDIWLAKSSDGGNSWSPPKRINNDTTGNHQFFTWMVVDQSTGNIFIVFYDRRNHTDDNTDVYLAMSNDGGNTFLNYKISEKPFKPSKNVFFGDYNCIAAHNGVVRPIWTRYDAGILTVMTAIIDIK